jgi:ABC-type transport system involved in multi-copper enzyme maturation permease subunit
VSVYKRSYRPYAGPLTGTREQFLALMRYAFAEAWASRVTAVLFVLCLSPALISMITIYIMNNETVRALMSPGRGPAPVLAMDERFFYVVLLSQCWPALALTAWVGPRLISTDMSNNALAVVLSHPITRVEYVLAKMSVLAGFLSAVTWIPLLLLFAFQSHLSATPWAMSHIGIAIGMFVGSWLWIILLSLMALAVASWVKWRIVATGLLFGFIFVPAGVGTVFNAVMRTDWGGLLNIPFMITTLWRRLVNAPIPEFMARHELPTTAILLSLTAIGFACVAALNARIRAREVVRG